VSHFVGAVLSGTEVVADGAAGMRALRLAMAANASAASSRAEDLDA